MMVSFCSPPPHTPRRGNKRLESLDPDFRAAILHRLVLQFIEFILSLGHADACVLLQGYLKGGYMRTSPPSVLPPQTMQADWKRGASSFWFHPPPPASDCASVCCSGKSRPPPIWPGLGTVTWDLQLLRREALSKRCAGRRVAGSRCSAALTYVQEHLPNQWGQHFLFEWKCKSCHSEPVQTNPTHYLDEPNSASLF